MPFCAVFAVLGYTYGQGYLDEAGCDSLIIKYL